MISSKQEFIKSFLPSTIEDITFVQIDLDITDLSVADILRNVNKTFPANSRNRNMIASGNAAVGILCKSEMLDPLSGLLLIITGGDIAIEVVSKNYIVIGISEDKITSDEDIKVVLDRITKYLVVSFKDSIQKFKDLYVKYIYDEYELEQSEEDDPYNVYIK